MKIGIRLVVLTAALALTGVGCKWIKNLGVVKIAPGTTVQLIYVLEVDGKVVDSSNGRAPFVFKYGNNEVIPGLEKGILGLKKGDRKMVTVAPEDGYGAVDPKAIQKIPRKAFKDMKNMKVGMRVHGGNGSTPMQATIVAISAKEVTLDFNHPMAGKTLNFDVEIAGVSH